ncbi:putative FAD-linked oxidoreductase YvdP [Streptomyces sp. enrichment culture]|uniref:FAD-binding oxidoreductase n=1 Tax=Streptomyces sp. enrichment culture TaxID=1795815 RepID=UPI003F56CED2
MIDRRNLLRAGGALAVSAATVSAATTSAAAAIRTAGTPDWESLRAAVGGDVVLPGDPAYDTAKQLAIGEFDRLTPQAVVYAESARDVQTAIRFARANGVKPRVRSGGHNFLGWSSGEGMILDVRRLNHVSGGGSPTVHVGPGTLSIEALEALKPYNQQLVTGTCHDVAVGGYVSGGGIGYQSRGFGVGCDGLVSAKVVLADGRLVTANEHCNPDLFWALRGGGGGNFGVVVDFEIRPISESRMVFYEQIWDWADAERFLTAWQEWYTETPRRSTGQVIVIQPDAGSGNPPTVLQQGAYYSTKADADAGLAELSSLVGAQPVNSRVLDLPYADGMKYVYGIAEGGSHPRTEWQRMRARLVSRPLGATGTADALAAFEAAPRSGQTRYLSFMGLGGAVADRAPNATAFVHRNALFHIGYGVSLGTATPSAEEAGAAVDWATRGFTVIDPLSDGHSYINFPDQYLGGWQNAYYGTNYPRLKALKQAYDPYRLFDFPRAIGN